MTLKQLWNKFKKLFAGEYVAVAASGIGKESAKYASIAAMTILLTCKTNEAGVSLIKASEKLYLQKYKCPGGKDTIGYGHSIQPGENIPDEITEEMAHNLLVRDIKSAERAVNLLVKVPLNDNQYSALVSFVFNLGGGALECSTLLHKLNRGDYVGAAEEFPRWVYAAGKRLHGLVRRRYLERQLFLS